MKRLLITLLFLLLLLSGCMLQPSSSEQTTPTAQADIPHEGTLMFTVAGDMNGTITMHTTAVISKLRHGHKEFTIDVVDGAKTVFLVFYGYTGPGTYVLANVSNGGEVYINLGGKQKSWDLTATPGATCTLTVSSDVASQRPGLDHMRGSFSCPHLAGLRSEQHSASIAVSNGQFDIPILVES